MTNANLVLKYDDIDIEWKRDIREQIIDDNAYYWLSATIIDWWDVDEVQPLSWVISPLNLIIDPKNYNYKLRYIWVRRRLPLFSILNNDNFNKTQVNKIKDIIDAELSKIENQINNSNWQATINDNEWMVDIYDHFTIYNWKSINNLVSW